MNTSVLAKRVLVYGDSFVYGKASGANVRLDAQTRFTGVLQTMLGNDHEIIEEGLRGRTLAGENGFFPDRDGLQQFSPILGSHLALDLVIMFLGTNDCNAKAGKTPQEVAESLRQYPLIISKWCAFLAVPEPKLLIIAPPAIVASHYDEAAHSIFGPDAPGKAAALPAAFERVAKELGADFASAAEVCAPAPGDGIHLDAVANRAIAQLLHDRVQEVLA